MPSGAKKMMLVSGRAFPELADEVAALPGHQTDADQALRLRQR